MDKNELKGHILSWFTIVIWGTTFISTKILLTELTPIEILFIRFVIGFIVLSLLKPKRLIVKDKKHELLFALAGLSGITLYYLLENIALTYTYASNVGVIVSITPFMTAIMAHFFIKSEKLKFNFFIGFIIAVFGIILISFEGYSSLQLNPLGDLLAVLATIAWSVYSITMKKLSAYQYDTIRATRKVFLYGLFLMIPALFVFDFSPNLGVFASPKMLFNILFLSLGASALCFVTWNFAVKVLGAIKTSVYIYAIPVITVITSVIVLHEKLTFASAMGAVLTLVGLFISEFKFEGKKKVSIE